MFPPGGSVPERCIMDLEDLVEPEVLVAVGVTAALMSPTVRGVLRKGAVYGLAGAMMAGDRVAAAARGVSTSARNFAASAGSTQAPTSTGHTAPEPVAS
jgi:hypothetical protein